MLTWILSAAMVIVLLFPFLAGKHFFQNKVMPHTTSPSELGIQYEEVMIPTKNKKQLYGWWMEKEGVGTRPVIIIVHGWGRNADRSLPYLEIFKDSNYHLMAFDARHHGSSDPDDFSSMIKFAEDIGSVIQWLDQKPTVQSQNLGLIGLSIGGSGSLYASALHDNVKAVATVGAFSDPEDLIQGEFKRRHFPQPIPWLVVRYFELVSKIRIKDVAPVNNMGKIKGNVFLIHGTKDRTIPFSEMKILEKASNPERLQTWSVEDYGHSDCHEHPDFARKVKKFFKEALG